MRNGWLHSHRTLAMFGEQKHYYCLWGLSSTPPRPSGRCIRNDTRQEFGKIVLEKCDTSNKNIFFSSFFFIYRYRRCGISILKRIRIVCFQVIMDVCQGKIMIQGKTNIQFFYWYGYNSKKYLFFRFSIQLFSISIHVVLGQPSRLSQLNQCDFTE